jgi:hypothetical protein
VFWLQEAHPAEAQRTSALVPRGEKIRKTKRRKLGTGNELPEEIERRQGTANLIPPSGTLTRATTGSVLLRLLKVLG